MTKSLLIAPENLTSSPLLKGLIYGTPGIGKTTLALSAPNPVCLDFDRGMKRVQAQWRVASLQIESFDQVLALLNSDELDGFSTIVIDTLGKMIDRIGDYVMKNNLTYRQKDGSLSQKGWGGVKMQFLNFLKLLDSKNKSIIFVAHESEEKEDDMTKKRPDVSGSARKDIMKELDFMGYMEVTNGKRGITFSPSEKFYSKNCLKIEGFIEIPSTDLGVNNFLTENIFKLNAEKLIEEAEKRESYNSLISLLKDNINGITTIEELNDFYEEKDRKQVIWDSKIVAAELFKTKVREMGAVFDKDSKKFVIKGE